MTIDRPKRDKKRGAGRVRTSGDRTRGETVKIKPKDEHACRTKNIKPRQNNRSQEENEGCRKQVRRTSAVERFDQFRPGEYTGSALSR
jgi:hypothetical protein